MADIPASTHLKVRALTTFRVANQDLIGRNYSIEIWEITGDGAGITAQIRTELRAVEFINFCSISATGFRGTYLSPMAKDVDGDVLVTFSAIPATGKKIRIRIEGLA